MKRQIEIEDTLDERVQDAKDELKEDFIDYLQENDDIDDFNTYYQAQGCDRAHAITDNNTPIYNKEIDDLYYLYGDELEEAFDNAGMYSNPSECNNYRQTCIYCYISQEVFDYMRSIEAVFDEYKEDGIDKVIEELENI